MAAVAKKLSPYSTEVQAFGANPTSEALAALKDHITPALYGILDGLLIKHTERTFDAPLRMDVCKHFLPSRPEPKVSSLGGLFAIRFVGKMLALKRRVRANNPDRPIKHGPAYHHDRRFYRYVLTPAEIRHSMEHIRNLSMGPKPMPCHEEVCNIVCMLANNYADFAYMLEGWESDNKGVMKGISAYRIATGMSEPTKALPDKDAAKEHLELCFPNRGRFFRVWLGRMRYLGLLDKSAPPPETAAAKRAREAKERRAALAKAKTSTSHQWMNAFLGEQGYGEWPTHSAFTGEPFKVLVARADKPNVQCPKRTPAAQAAAKAAMKAKMEEAAEAERLARIEARPAEDEDRWDDEDGPEESEAARRERFLEQQAASQAAMAENPHADSQKLWLQQVLMADAQGQTGDSTNDGAPAMMMMEDDPEPEPVHGKRARDDLPSAPPSAARKPYKIPRLTVPAVGA